MKKYLTKTSPLVLALTLNLASSNLWALKEKEIQTKDTNVNSNSNSSANVNANANTNQIKSDSNKRISISISSDSMNRIAFVNDRISQVFGDEEAYTLQTDERGGQIFLKPSEANGDKSIPITITTEQNLVQDLELLPKKTTSRTIIIKNEDKYEKTDSFKASDFERDRSSYFGPYQSSSPSNFYGLEKTGPSDYSALLVKTLKLVALMENLSSASEMPRELKISDLEVLGVQVVKLNGFEVSIYKVTNPSVQVYEIVENAFGDSGVLAIALFKKELSFKESTKLFVVRNI